MAWILRSRKAPKIEPLVFRVPTSYYMTTIIIMKIYCGKRFGIGMVLKGSNYFYGNVTIIIFLQMKPITKEIRDLLYAKIVERLIKLFCMF